MPPFADSGIVAFVVEIAVGSLVLPPQASANQGRANWGAYATSKFATEGMMQVLADEYQNRHLRVNCINPGGTRTGMRAQRVPDGRSAKIENARRYYAALSLSDGR